MELTIKGLLLVFRNWRRKKAKKRKRDRKLKRNGEKERGNGSVNEKGGNAKERGNGSANEKRRRNGSVNESGIGIATGLKIEIVTVTEIENVTETVNGAQIATRIGVDQGK